MTNIEAVPRSRLARLKGVLADIDGTLSHNGRIRPTAYEAMWRLHEAGLIVIPVTGRPAGWCDHIARCWPVDAVVGENGGLYFRHDGQRLVRRFLHDADQRRDFRRRLDAIRERILAEVPGCAVASDQPYRECDLAIDWCEDVAPLPREAVLRIRTIFEEAGAHAKISSIHVNGWFGDFDKLSTTKLCVREITGIDLDRDREAFAFCGDSPNDEPMFAFFPMSFGMANITAFRDLLTHPPSFVATHPDDEGFHEVANLILEARRE